jgi:transposase-like protein
MKEPNTLQEVIRYYADEQTCINTIAALRWPDGKPACPSCAHKEHYWLATQKRWKCKKCGRQFSVKRGTIFEDSPLALEKWLTALWMIVNCKNGISSYEVARDLKITQKSAWFMLHRLRLALQSRSLVKIGGTGKTVEVDETFIGGLSRNMHKAVRDRKIHGTGGRDKTPVLGFLERNGEVRTMVPKNRRRNTLHGEIEKNVGIGSIVCTDAFPSYEKMAEDYKHKVIDHAVAYAHGAVHTNGMENYWSLLKRGIKGTYVSVEPFHLFRYLDEQAFRFNNRGNKENPISDGERFTLALSQIAGRRLTFAQVTGKVDGGSAN